MCRRYLSIFSEDADDDDGDDEDGADDGDHADQDEVVDQSAPCAIVAAATPCVRIWLQRHFWLGKKEIPKKTKLKLLIIIMHYKVGARSITNPTWH